MKNFNHKNWSQTTILFLMYASSHSTIFSIHLHSPNISTIWCFKFTILKNSNHSNDLHEIHKLKILYNPLIWIDLAHWVHSSRLYIYFCLTLIQYWGFSIVTCSTSFHGSNDESQSHLINVLPPLSRVQCHKLKNIAKMVKIHKKF